MSPANYQGNLTKCCGITCDGLASHPGVVAILLVASCYRNQDKLQQCGPHGSCADSWLLPLLFDIGSMFTTTFTFHITVFLQ